MKVAGHKSVLNPVVYTTDISKGVVLLLFLVFVDLCFILLGDLFSVLR